MQRLNKGEWAEFYAFIKLLADGRIYYGDEKLNRIEAKFFDVDKILKTKNEADQIFYIQGKDIKFENSNISREKLKNSAKNIFQEIAKNSNTFSIKEAENLKHILNLKCFSEPASSKIDIRLSLIDKLTNTSSTYGFSIKSKLKAKSTLINSSGKSTGFRYKIEDFNLEKLELVNSIEGKSKVNQRVKKILEISAGMSFFGMTSEVYKNNLRTVDTSLDLIIGEMLLSAYVENKKILKDSINTHRFSKFLVGLELSKESIIYKIKNFLYISATGMTPSKVWVGHNEVDGGLIIVKSSGDLVGYFIFFLSKFKEYLWQNTFFETPSTSRHKFGYVFKQDGNFYFDLNIQVRFVL